MVKAKTLIVASLTLFCCASLRAQDAGYITEWSRIPVRALHGDRKSPSSLKEKALLEKCRPGMDSLMRVVGFSTKEMSAYPPQSPLGNFCADMLLSECRTFAGIDCDLSILNVFGIRADMPKGDVTVDDLRSMFPFKNYLAVVRLSGSKLLEWFRFMASNGWQVFSGVKVVAGSEGLKSVTIGGQPLEEERIYSLATNDFMLNGGDGFRFADGAQQVIRTDISMFSAAMDYFDRLREEGKPVQGGLDDRLVLEDAPSAVPAPSAGVSTSENTGAKSILTILHTNDTHSHLDTLRSGPHTGMAGVEARAFLIDSVRKADGASRVLLLDAGDFFQGTSYFSIFGGRAEIGAMNIMKYDAVTIGNHEWDNGIPELCENLRRAHFKAVLTNYTVDDKILASRLKPYAIVHRGGLKIGILGMLTDVTSVVKNSESMPIHYLNPVESVNKWASYLKNEKKCDVVILLSHCGYDIGTAENPDELTIAPQLSNVDILIGGHSHTDLDRKVDVTGADGRKITLVTDYCWGVYLGEIKLATEH